MPCWHASDKLEYAARTIRNKINSKLDEFVSPLFNLCKLKIFYFFNLISFSSKLTEFPPVITHPHKPEASIVTPVDWIACYDSLKVDNNVKIVDWAIPGYTGGIKTLQEFIQNRLRSFDEDRNDPNKSALSNLSPWYHFGQVSVQRCIIEIKKYSSKYSKSVQGYMEGNIKFCLN